MSEKVVGARSGTEFTKEDIFNPLLYPRMKDEPLLNEDDELVVPVRNEGAPHFRRMGRRSFGRAVGRRENNPTHNACVDFLHRLLASETNGGVEISTYVFADDRTYEEQVIFSTLPGTRYVWFKEGDARVAFEDGSYIQPDLAGRDANRFFPRSSCPNVIIEVVRTHEPDPETFKRLCQLSLENTLVVFYVIGEGSRGGLVNNHQYNSVPSRLRVSMYLISGQPYLNGKALPLKGENESIEHWYQYLVDRWFIVAKEKASQRR